MAQRRKTPALTYLDQATHAPRADLPTTKEGRRSIWMRRAVWAVTVSFLPLMILVLYLSTLPQGAGEEHDLGVNTDSFNDHQASQARAIATVHLETWLSSEPSPLPKARIISWNGARPVPAFSEPDEDGESPGIFVAHDFTIHRGSSLFSVRVTTVVDPVAGAVPVGSPSLMPLLPAPDSLTGGDVWPGAQSVPVTVDVQQALTQWANAFTSSDPKELRLAVGDLDQNHSYLPLVGASLEEIVVVSATVQPQWLDDRGMAPEDPEEIVARVALSLSWGQPNERDDNGELVDLQPIHYDVLVLRANTASPQIVGWGGPGDGATLTPYINAIEGREVLLEPQQGDQ